MQLKLIEYHLAWEAESWLEKLFERKGIRLIFIELLEKQQMRKLTSELTMIYINLDN